MNKLQREEFKRDIHETKYLLKQLSEKSMERAIGYIEGLIANSEMKTGD